MGQYVKSGSAVATIAGTDQAEIVVPLPVLEMVWLDTPRAGEQRKGSKAIVSVQLAEETYTWAGWLDRATGEVDIEGRMARIVAKVADPYGQKAKSHHPHLVTNMFVTVAFSGRTIKDVIAIPRSALREFDMVWIMDKAQKLRLRKVTIKRRERDTVLVSAGLVAGDQVVLTYLSGAADGMLLRPVQEGGK